MTNVMEFIIKGFTLSEGNSDICSEHLLQYTNLTNSLEFKTGADMTTSIYRTNTSSQTLTPFIGASFVNDCLLQPMLHVNHPLLQFIDIADPLLSTAVLFSRFYSYNIQSSIIKAAAYLAR